MTLTHWNHCLHDWYSLTRPIIGVVSYGALRHVPIDFQQCCFSSLRSRTKSITANAIWFFIPYKRKNARNWQREAFCYAIKALKSFSYAAVSRPPLGVLYDATFNPLGGRGWGMPSIGHELTQMSLNSRINSLAMIYQFELTHKRVWVMSLV